MKLLIALSLVSASLQAAISERQSGPTVTIQNGTVIGVSSNGVESFKGIPFAQPPVGTRRLRAPIPLATGFGTLTASADGQGCPPFGATSTSSAPGPTGTPGSAGPEDCLFINVQRPAGARAGSNIPVVAYMYGGGFTEGSTVGTDASAVIASANSIAEPIMFVAFNYRLAGWGFMSGSELAREGNTNIGLKDQRLALQWIRDNIRAFGGDPSQVTLWGESAGSISILDHLLINGGNNQYNGGPLFRAAILSSGATIPAFAASHPRPQGTFDGLASAAGCGSAANKLDCIRAVDFNTFANAQRSAAGAVSQGPVAYLPRPDPSSTFFPVSPEKALAAGNFAKVPIIVGAQEDEGPVFTQAYSQFASSTTRIVALLRYWCPELTNAEATAIVNTYPAAYPDRVTEGSPYYSGLQYEIYTGYKRISAFVGDFLFIWPSRLSLESLVPAGVPVWASIGTYFRNTSSLGTRHGLDTPLVLNGPANLPAANEKKFRYLSFWRYANPNTLGLKQNPNYPQWPRYALDTKQLANFGPGGAGLLTDDFRQSNYDVFKRNHTKYST